jgi:hypothetical protein
MVRLVLFIVGENGKSEFVLRTEFSMYMGKSTPDDIISRNLLLLWSQ